MRIIALRSGPTETCAGKNRALDASGNRAIRCALVSPSALYKQYMTRALWRCCARAMASESMPQHVIGHGSPEPQAAQDQAASNSKVIEQAIAWMVRLQSAAVRPADVKAWWRWRAEHPSHEYAWAQLDAMSRRLQSLPSDPAHATLKRLAEYPRGSKRRTVLKSIALLVASGLVAFVGRDWPAWQRLVADYSTGIGQRRKVSLADGSRVSLNTDTAIDTAYDSARRLIRLRRGEILVTTAPDPALAHRPFVVRTIHGRMRAHNARFLVYEQGDSTLVSVLEGALEVEAQDSRVTIKTPAGRQVRFSRDYVGRMQTADSDRAAWSEGVLIAKGVPLAALSQTLRRYRIGYLGCDGRAGALEISGAFPLDDTDRILAVFEQTLPITVTRHTRYWVSMRHR